MPAWTAKPKGTKIEDVAKRIVVLLKSREPVTLFCGAGVSMRAPSNAPNWQELRDGLIHALLKRVEGNKLLSQRDATHVFSQLDEFQSSHDLWLKPEVALHWCHMQFGDRLFDAFKVLDVGEPNRNHTAITAMAETHGDICLVTPNFDRYFEGALREANVPFRVFAGDRVVSHILPRCRFKPVHRWRFRSRQLPILKIHGTLEYPVTIQATLRQVARPLSRTVAEAFLSAFSNRHVIVTGYSGNDADLFPLFLKVAQEARSVIWLARSRKSLRPEIKSALGNQFVAYGDLNLLFDILTTRHLRGKRGSERSHSVSQREQRESPFSLEDWATKIDAGRAAYALGLLAMNLGLFDIAYLMANAILERGKVDGTLRCRAWNLAGVSFRRRDPDKAMALYERGEREARAIRHKDPVVYGNILGNMAALLHQQGRHSRALSLLQRSLVWARKAKNDDLVADNEDDIGNILRVMDQPRKAIRYHRRVLRYRRTKGDLIGLGLAMNNIGLAYMDMGEFDKAEEYLLESVRLKKQESANWAALARGLMNLGEAQLLAGNLRSTIRNLQEALDLGHDIWDKIVVCRCRYDLAEAWRRAGRRDLAMKTFRSAERMASQMQYWQDDSYRMRWINAIRRSFSVLDE